MRDDEISEHCLCDKCSGNDCEGLKDIEGEKLISVIDEKIANARVAAANAVLDELAQMYANVPEQFLNGTYRLHLEWKAKIESLRHGQTHEQQGTTAGGR